MNEVILNVEGMHCEGCEKRIKNSISELDGVDCVVADHNDGRVKVTLNKNMDKKLIIDTIEDIGFEVKEEQ